MKIGRAPIPEWAVNVLRDTQSTMKNFSIDWRPRYVVCSFDDCKKLCTVLCTVNSKKAAIRLSSIRRDLEFTEAERIEAMQASGWDVKWESGDE